MVDMEERRYSKKEELSKKKSRAAHTRTHKLSKPTSTQKFGMLQNITNMLNSGDKKRSGD